MGRIARRGVAAGSRWPQIRHVTPVRAGPRDRAGRRVYQQVERDFGMLAPPVALHSPAPDVLAASWLMLRESLLADGPVDRAAKEAVAAAVSLGQRLPVLRRRAQGDAARRWTRGLRSPTSWRSPASGGRPRGRRARGARGHGRAAGPPLPRRARRELPAWRSPSTTSTAWSNVFLGDSPLPPEVPAGARGPALRLFGRLMRPAARAGLPARATRSACCPPRRCPPTWPGRRAPRTSPRPSPGPTAAIEAAGRRSVPDAVRELVTARLAGWDGRPAGLSRAWVADAVAPLPAAQRAGGPPRPAHRAGLLPGRRAVVDGVPADRRPASGRSSNSPRGRAWPRRAGWGAGCPSSPAVPESRSKSRRQPDQQLKESR